MHRSLPDPVTPSRRPSMRSGLVDMALLWLVYTVGLIARDLTGIAPIDYRSALPFAALASAVVVGCVRAAGAGPGWWPAVVADEVVRLAVAVAGATMLIVAVDLAWPTGGDRPLPLSVILLGGFFGLSAMLAVRYREQPFALLERALRAVRDPQPSASSASGAFGPAFESGPAGPRIPVALPAYGEGRVTTAEQSARRAPGAGSRAAGADAGETGRALREHVRTWQHAAEALGRALTTLGSLLEPATPRARAVCYALLIVGLMTLFGFWSVLGVTFYGKVEPFFDSLSYQAAYFRVIDASREQGYVPVLQPIRAPSTTFSYTLFSALLAPLLPRSVLGLYAIMYGLAFFSLLATFYAAEKVASSWLKALAFMLFILSAAIFSSVWGGILDQRLDLLAGLLFLASVMTCWLLFSAPAAFRHWVLFLVTTTLSIIHRPTVVPQLALVYLVIAGFHYGQIATVARLVRVRHALAVALAVGFIAWLILPSRDYLEYYYLVWNVDVGRAETVREVLRFVGSSMRWALGGYVAITVTLLLMCTLSVRRYADAAFSVALVTASIVPFVISRSSANPLILLPSSLVATLGYFAVIRRIRGNTVVALLLLSAVFVLGNLRTIYDEVRAVSPEQREVLDRVRNRMIESAEPVYVSGTAPVAASIVAIDGFYGSGKLVGGKLLSHSTEYGLGKTYDISEPEAMHKVRESLRDICRFHGYAVFPVPSGPDDEKAYLFSFRHASLIWKEQSQLGCLGEQVDAFRHGGADYAVYLVPGGAVPAMGR